MVLEGYFNFDSNLQLWLESLFWQYFTSFWFVNKIQLIKASYQEYIEICNAYSTYFSFAPLIMHDEICNLYKQSQMELQFYY